MSHKLPLIILFLSTRIFALTEPASSALEAKTWFQDAKYGLFIHWGAYSILGNGEWVMEHQKIAVDHYEQLANNFNPTQFDPAAWVALAKAAGMKYIVITSKHHDGFALFDSKASDWNAVRRTPYKKDIIKMLADECHKEGIKLFLYYSQLDWHHPDYCPRGNTGHYTKRPVCGTWDNYIAFMNQQLTELLTQYGEIAGIWFDGWWDRPDADWHLETTYKLIHDLQPQALIGSNHHQKPSPGEDFQMFEQDLPGKNNAGFSEQSVISDLPLETCDTLNASWGFNLTDKKFKNPHSIIHYLVKAAGAGANFLLNVGPMPNGTIQPEFTERLLEVGRWLSRYGESLYGTRKGPLAERCWGVTTRKDNTVYLHLLAWNMADPLYVPLATAPVSARYMKDGSPVDYTHDGKGILIKNIPATAVDQHDTIIALELDSDTNSIPLPDIVPNQLSSTVKNLL